MPLSSMLLTGLDKNWEDVNLEKLGNTVCGDRLASICVGKAACHLSERMNTIEKMRVIFLVFSVDIVHFCSAPHCLLY